jgi:hypothetical protein
MSWNVAELAAFLKNLLSQFLGGRNEGRASKKQADVGEGWSRCVHQHCHMLRLGSVVCACGVLVQWYWQVVLKYWAQWQFSVTDLTWTALGSNSDAGVISSWGYKKTSNYNRQPENTNATFKETNEWREVRKRNWSKRRWFCFQRQEHIPLLSYVCFECWMYCAIFSTLRNANTLQRPATTCIYIQMTCVWVIALCFVFFLRFCV